VTPLESYQQDIENGKIEPDKFQQMAVQHTQALYKALLDTPKPAPKKGLLSFFQSTQITPIKGLYCWGGVGRGKSYLIDTFFNCLPITDKKRIHFNHFMQDIHSKLKVLPKTPDPLVIVAEELAQKYRVICIDEFHVDDITDAMIMAGFLNALFTQGVTLVFTSNIEPDELYKNGLQRDRFLPAIKLIKEHTLELQLDNGKDYRLALLEKHGTFHVINEQNSIQIMEQHMNELTNTSIERNKPISINGRDIQCIAQTDQQIWFDFKELCQTARSSKDYIALAQDFETILVSDIHAMDDSHNDVIQRFIQLIDALYDHKVKFIATAIVETELLYQGESLAFPFQRALSRLIEMRSQKYLSEPHISD
jgi:cell division protein ZapE